MTALGWNTSRDGLWTLVTATPVQVVATNGTTQITITPQQWSDAMAGNLTLSAATPLGSAGTV